MLVGILSDTHDKADTTRAALDLLQSRGASQFIHCGDVGSPQVIDLLVGLRAVFVWGNCDYDRMSLSRYANRLGVQCFGPFGEMEIDGKLFAILHGDDASLKRKLLAEQRHDYLLQGHSHQKEDTRIGRVRLINPGALHRVAVKTVGLLDPVSDSLQFLTVS